MLEANDLKLILGGSVFLLALALLFGAMFAVLNFSCVCGG